MQVANLARGQLNREIDISLSLFAPEILVSRDGFGSPVSRQPAHLHTQAESSATFVISPDFRGRVHSFILTAIRHLLPISAAAFTYLLKPPDAIGSVPVTQSRTDGVHCREPAGTGPVNLKVF